MDQAEATILREVDNLEPELVRLTSDLVGFRTLRLTGEDFRQCCDYINLTWRDIGLESQIHEVPASYSGPFDAEGSHYRHLGLSDQLAPRYNVVASLAGSGGGKSLHLNGHYCVVEPPKGWTSDPFTPKLEGDRLTGRGAIDMKGGLAATTIALTALRNAGIVPRGTVHLSATVDTHFGGDLGAGYIAQAGLGRADRVIVTDTSGPTCILQGYRGQLWLEVEFLGRGAHGSTPFFGVNPTQALAAAIIALNDHADELKQRESQEAIVPPEARAPSLTVGSSLRAAAMVNQVPGSCYLGIDRRLIPEETADSAQASIEAVLAVVREAHPDVKVTARRLFAAPPTVTSNSDPLITTLADAVSLVTGTDAQVLVHPAFLDLQWFTTTWGVPGAVYGPGDGGALNGFRSKPYAEPDESIAVSDLTAATKVLALAIARLTG